jgi:tetrahydromethanopterin S-methyltransferase subunit G
MDMFYGAGISLLIACVEIRRLERRLEELEKKIEGLR